MPIESPSPFMAAYVNHDTCELFLIDGQITAFIPTRENWAQSLDMRTASFTEAVLIVQAMGLQPTWD